MILLNGKKTSDLIKEEISQEVLEIIKNGDRPPHLAAILVGDNPASLTYVSAKVKACDKVGFKSSLIKLHHDVSEEDLISHVDNLNKNVDIDGFIVQLPLPNHINEKKILEKISPNKDVDGFHPINFGKMCLDIPCFIPATPFGIVELLRRYNLDLDGKNCVVLGRSHIVGTPISILLSKNKKIGNCTVTLAHSKTKNIKHICNNADIIISAIGKPNFITEDMVKDGVVIVDVGINRVKSNKTKSGWKLVGDVDFENVSNKCSYITPVPGGVGPMTIVSLLKNTLLAKKNVFS